MGNLLTIKSVVSASVFFILGMSAVILYNQYNFYKWQMKFKIHESLYTLQQIEKLNNFDAALIRVKKNVACEVDNYVKRNKEVGFEIDQAFVDATMQQVQVSCE